MANGKVQLDMLTATKYYAVKWKAGRRYIVFNVVASLPLASQMCTCIRPSDFFVCLERAGFAARLREKGCRKRGEVWRRWAGMGWYEGCEGLFDCFAAVHDVVIWKGYCGNIVGFTCGDVI